MKLAHKTKQPTHPEHMPRTLYLVPILLAFANAQSGYNASIAIPFSATDFYLSMYALPDSNVVISNFYAMDVRTKSVDEGYAATVSYTDFNTHVLTVIGVRAFSVYPSGAGVCASHPKFDIAFDVFELVLSYDSASAPPFYYEVGFVRPDGCHRSSCSKGRVESGVSVSTTCVGDVNGPVPFSFTLSLVHLHTQT
jgi:hypothetical protein